MEKEIWKPVSITLSPYWLDGINITHEVSNFGRIRNKKTGNIMSIFIKDGVPFWTMHCRYPGSDYDLTLQFRVSHTVYSAFKGDCYGKHVNHKDGNIFNNELDNLFIK